jgi:DNA repair exonuclease SbcCD ATPase subunit
MQAIEIYKLIEDLNQELRGVARGRELVQFRRQLKWLRAQLEKIEKRLPQF